MRVGARAGQSFVHARHNYHKRAMCTELRGEVVSPAIHPNKFNKFKAIYCSLITPQINGRSSGGFVLFFIPLHVSRNSEVIYVPHREVSCK